MRWGHVWANQFLDPMVGSVKNTPAKFSSSPLKNDGTGRRSGFLLKIFKDGKFSGGENVKLRGGGGKVVKAPIPTQSQRLNGAGVLPTCNSPWNNYPGFERVNRRAQMVSKWVITPIYRIYKQVIAHVLTIWWAFFLKRRKCSLSAVLLWYFIDSNAKTS